MIIDAHKHDLKRFIANMGHTSRILDFGFWSVEIQNPKSKIQNTRYSPRLVPLA